MGSRSRQRARDWSFLCVDRSPDDQPYGGGVRFADAGQKKEKDHVTHFHFRVIEHGSG
jgi:hypothetical protein